MQVERSIEVNPTGQESRAVEPLTNDSAVNDSVIAEQLRFFMIYRSRTRKSAA